VLIADNVLEIESIKDAASTTTYAMMTYYHGNETGHIPGAFASKWWEGSALFLALLQYWHFTGDTTYNEELRVGLQWQSGSDGDYMPSNYSSYLVITCPSYRLAISRLRRTVLTFNRRIGKR
jgi:mannan endo-1,6-alpha-mannosidase